MGARGAREVRLAVVLEEGLQGRGRAPEERGQVRRGRVVGGRVRRRDRRQVVRAPLRKAGGEQRAAKGGRVEGLIAHGAADERRQGRGHLGVGQRRGTGERVGGAGLRVGVAQDRGG